MEDFASLDSLNELCNAVDFDSLIESSEKPLEAKKTIRPLFLATMRPSRRKGFEDSLAIQEEELFFNGLFFFVFACVS
jgi:hypothetical protein